MSLVINKLDCLIDIWNHHSEHKEFPGENERYTLIDELNHRYASYLEEILIIFKEWHDNRRNETECIPTSLYKSLCWLVYGMTGVVTYLSEDKSYFMVQRRGGTNNFEHEFVRIKNKF